MIQDSDPITKELKQVEQLISQAKFKEAFNKISNIEKYLKRKKMSSLL